MRLLKLLLILFVLSFYTLQCDKDHDHKHDHHDHKEDKHKAHHDDHEKDKDHDHKEGKHEEHHDDHAHKKDKDHDHDHKEEGHHHEPLHKAQGATMKAIGDHFAHIEMVLKEDGHLTLWITDGEAENAIRLKQEEIKIKIANEEIILKGIENSLTGEKLGDTSQFEAKVETLKGKKEFDGEVLFLKLKGKEFKNIKFNYPLASEHN